MTHDSIVSSSSSHKEKWKSTNNYIRVERTQLLGVSQSKIQDTDRRLMFLEFP